MSRPGEQHANQRLQERFGLSLTKHTRWLVLEMVQSGCATFVRDDRLGRTVWDVHLHSEIEVRVVVAKNLAAIVTFLPKR
jgi:hypothetical protein